MGKKEAKASSFVNMILHVRDSKDPIRKFLDLINAVNKVAA